MFIRASYAPASYMASTTLKAARRTILGMLFSSPLCRSSKASIQAFAEGALQRSVLIAAGWASSPEEVQYGKKCSIATDPPHPPLFYWLLSD
jgi:hypothetical protein